MSSDHSKKTRAVIYGLLGVMGLSIGAPAPGMNRQAANQQMPGGPQRESSYWHENSSRNSAGNRPKDTAAALDSTQRNYFLNLNALRLQNGQPLLSNKETREKLERLTQNPEAIIDFEKAVGSELDEEGMAIRDSLVFVAESYTRANTLFAEARDEVDPGEKLYQASLKRREADKLITSLRLNIADLADAGLLESMAQTQEPPVKEPRPTPEITFDRS